MTTSKGRAGVANSLASRGEMESGVRTMERCPYCGGSGLRADGYQDCAYCGGFGCAQRPRADDLQEAITPLYRAILRCAAWDAPR